jgi:RimJ/RimL family protein N-acetyltransferase
MLESERLVLRRVTPADAESFHAIFGDAEVMRFVGAGLPFSKRDVADLIERIDRRFEADGFGQLAVVRRNEGDVIGRVGLLPLEPETWRAGARAEIGEAAEIELGWTLARRAWGHGYAFEAASAVRELARDAHGLHDLVSIVQVGNVRSAALARRLGAACEREITTSFGKRAQLYRYDLTRSPPGS